MIDFSLLIYKNLLETLIVKKYKFQTVEEYFSLSSSVAQLPSHPVTPSPNTSLTNSPLRPLAPSQKRPVVIMRHDVDRKPQNSLRIAELEKKLGVKATYYFRTIPQTFKPDLIKAIADLGHEIGYHYECLAETNGEYEKAVKDFEKNLAKLREIVPIKNIAMHGRPTSKLDSRDLWKQYNYKDYGITSEPYFDMDFNKVQYITDAGRSWDNSAINLRDKVESPFSNTFKHIEGIIKAVQNNQLSDQLMINIHPEHWAASKTEWLKIWVVRKVKNAVKRVVLGRR